MKVFLASLAFLCLALCALSAPPAGAADTASPYADWSAVVVAGDWHAEGGAASTAFDNARREIVKRLVSVGFDPAHIRQLSARPDLYPSPDVWHADGRSLESLLKQLLPKAPGGCLIYWTSHGSPDGAVMDASLLSPGGLKQILDDTCEDRPTVVVVSACYSGVFIPILRAPNRMVLTAARDDRSSFGCGTDNVYPYFDECMIISFPKAQDFPALGRAAQACVAEKEQSQGLSPPSDPQMSVGASIGPELVQDKFSLGGTRLTCGAGVASASAACRPTAQ